MWYPGAVKKEIRPGENDPMIVPIGVILHTDAGNSASLFNYFNGPSGGIESHFHIPKVNPVEQYRDTGYEADANLKANSFWVNGIRFGFLSVETQGYATDPWNDYQLAEIKKLILWARSVHKDIQLRVCPGPFSAGIGYHVMFGAPGPWTPVAKVCPGPLRVKQFEDILVPWFKNPVSPLESDMSAEDVKAINDYTAAVSTQIQKHIDQLIDDIGRSAAAATMALLNTDELAAKIVASLPSGAVDQATVEAGVRAVLKAGTDPSA
jgi:hypothetical protein